MNDTLLQSLAKLLQPGGADAQDRHLHCILDGARDPAIAGLVRASGLEHACLFSGPLHPRLEAAAPYLVRLAPDAPASAQLLRRGWGQSWGILAGADAGVPFDALRLHLKKFLRVKTEDGKTLAFRYYDPRVLNVFLPTCTPDEFKDFLGPMAGLLAETGEGAGVRTFDLEDGAMRVQDHPLDAPATAS